MLYDRRRQCERVSALLAEQVAGGGRQILKGERNAGNMSRVPRVRQAQACNDYVLRVTFDNGVMRLYDLKPNLIDERFSILRDRDFSKPCRLKTEDSGLAGTVMLT